jgi:2-polyprenyl-6-hydroxyphenyl methylase/3-demethylubiquinone-9 3-methyltransferase
MKRVYIENNWKENWKYSYPYDLLEIYGETSKDLGYAYAYEIRRDYTLSLIKSVTKRGDNILDIAAGQGNFSLTLAEMGYRVTWNDIREDLAEYVEMKKEMGCISYKPGNVFTTQFEEPFDLVLATEIIEHVAHPDEFLANLANLVKPGGYIVITTPLGSYFKNKLPRFSEFSDASVFEAKQFAPNEDGHIFLLHLDEFYYLAKKAGLNIIKIKYYSNPLTFGHIKLSFLLKILPKKWVLGIEGFTQRLPEFIGRHIHNNFAVLLKKGR